MCNNVPVLPRGRQQRRRRRRKGRKMFHDVALRFTKPAPSFYETHLTELFVLSDNVNVQNMEAARLR